MVDKVIGDLTAHHSPLKDNYNDDIRAQDSNRAPSNRGDILNDIPGQVVVDLLRMCTVTL